MDNNTRRQLLEQAKSTGFQGDILDVFKAYDQGVNLLEQPQQTQVLNTPQEQQQGLSNIPLSQAPQKAIFPNTSERFNTTNMKFPIDVEFRDQNTNHLVESFKNVPPGVQDFGVGPYKGELVAIETPSSKQSGGVIKAQSSRNKLPPSNIQITPNQTVQDNLQSPVFEDPRVRAQKIAAAEQQQGLNFQNQVKEYVLANNPEATPEQIDQSIAQTAATGKMPEYIQPQGQYQTYGSSGQALGTQTFATDPKVRAAQKAYNDKYGFSPKEYSPINLIEPMAQGFRGAQAGPVAANRGYLTNNEYNIDIPGSVVAADLLLPFAPGLARAGVKGLKAIPGVTRQGLNQTGKFLTTQTPLKNAYKLNPNRFQPKAGNYYSQVSKPAIDDARKTGLVRIPTEKVDDLLSPNNTKRFLEEIRTAGSRHPSYHQPYPYFERSDLHFGYRPKGKEYLIETNLPSSNFTSSRTNIYRDPKSRITYNQATKKFDNYDKSFFDISSGKPEPKTVILNQYPNSRKLINPTTGKETYTFYEPHWWKGYKPVNMSIPKQSGGSTNSRKSGIPYKDVTGAPYNTENIYYDAAKNVSKVAPSELESYRLLSMDTGSYKPYSHEEPDVQYDPETGYNYQMTTTPKEYLEKMEKPFNKRRFILNPIEGQMQTRDAYMKETPEGPAYDDSISIDRTNKTELLTKSFEEIYAAMLLKYPKEIAYDKAVSVMKEEVEPEYINNDFYDLSNISDVYNRVMNPRDTRMSINPENTAKILNDLEIALKNDLITEDAGGTKEENIEAARKLVKDKGRILKAVMKERKRLDLYPKQSGGAIKSPADLKYKSLPKY